MAKHLVDKTGCLEACQNRCEELVAIPWIQLKINETCRRVQKELILTNQTTKRDLWERFSHAHPHTQRR